MPHLSRFLLLAAALLPALHATAPAAATAEAARIARVENGLLPPARIAGTPPETWTIPARMAFYQVPGVSIALINHGAIEWARGYGMTNSKAPSPVTPDTPFHAGVLREPVLDIAILTLAEAGQLTVHSYIGDLIKSPKFYANMVGSAKFSALLLNRVLHPLEMRATAFDPNPSIGLQTTPSDLARFALALQQAYTGHPGPLSRASAEAMLTRRDSPGDLGLELKGAGADFSFRRGDHSENACSFLVAFPRTGQGAVVMINSGAGVMLAGEILRAIACEYAWPDYQVVEKATVALAPAAFDNFAGIYERDDTVLRIFREGGRFYLKPRSQPRLEIFPRSDHEFFLLDEADTFSFERNAEGIVTHFIRRHPGGGPQVFRRAD